jgi:transposase
MVPLPSNSSCCAAPIVYEDTKPQFQEDIVGLTIVRKFDIQVDRCACCGRHVQGRHPLQTSDAFSQFTGLLRSPSQKILDLVPAVLSP